MDWAKAKNILIVIFLTVNVFLFGNLISYKMGQGVSKETIRDTEHILNSRGVTLKCDIPDKAVDPLELTYGEKTLDRQKVSQTLLGFADNNSRVQSANKTLVFPDEYSFTFEGAGPTQSIGSLDEKTVENHVKRLLKEFGAPASDYVQDRFIKNKDGSITSSYVYQYWGFLMFDDFIEVTLSENGINYIKCKYREISNNKRPGKKVMPAYLVLLKNYPDNSSAVIVDIDNGILEYKDEEGSFQGYVWRVKQGDGSTRYFKAIDGNEVKKEEMGK